jgi:predicted Zn finger-like uncharacterized protein
MNTACPSCATVYAVTPSDVGRRIACAKCGTNLRVADAGLEAEPKPDPAPGMRPPDNPLLAAARTWAKDIDPPTFLFSAGILTVLFFVAMPTIAAAKVDRRLAQSQEAAFEHAVKMRALQEKKESEKAIKDAEEKWAKARTDYEDAVESAKFDRAKGAYFERYGLLLGNLLAAGGAVWLLRTDQPLPKRIVAAVVVTVQVLLAFQTATPVGCGPPARAYNRPVPAPTELEPRS